MARFTSLLHKQTPDRSWWSHTVQFANTLLREPVQPRTLALEPDASEFASQPHHFLCFKNLSKLLDFLCFGFLLCPVGVETIILGLSLTWAFTGARARQQGTVALASCVQARGPSQVFPLPWRVRSRVWSTGYRASLSPTIWSEYRSTQKHTRVFLRKLLWACSNTLRR